MSETVLLTGATGHLGRWIALEHLRRGDGVLAMLRRPQEQGPAMEAWLTERGAPAGSFRAVAGDLAAEGLGLAPADGELLRAVTRVEHFGALWGFGISPAEARRVNVEGTRALMAFAATLPRLQRFIHSSGFMLTLPAHLTSAGVRPDGRTDWAQVYCRVGAYEASKYESHFAVRAQAEALGVPTTIVHPATATGHSQTGEILGTQALVELTEQMLAGRLTAVPGSPRHRLPLVTVDYLAAFVVRSADHAETAGKELLVLDPGTPPLAEALAWLARGAGARAPRCHVPLPVLRAVLAVPGLARAASIQPEGLAFIRDEVFDVRVEQTLAARMGLVAPSITTALEVSGRWIATRERRYG